MAGGAEKGLVGAAMAGGPPCSGLMAILVGSRGARVGGGASLAGRGAGGAAVSWGLITGAVWRAPFGPWRAPLAPRGLKSSDVSEESPELPWK